MENGQQYIHLIKPTYRLLRSKLNLEHGDRTWTIWNNWSSKLSV